MPRSQEHSPTQVNHYLEKTIETFKDKLQDQQLRAAFEAWLQRRDAGYLNTLSLFLDHALQDNPDTIKVLIQNFNYMANELGKIDHAISIPVAPGSMSIMGRTIHPQVAAQIAREWSNTTSRLQLRNNVQGDERLSTQDKTLILGFLDREMPLNIVKAWYANLIAAKLELTSPLYDQLIQMYTEVLHLLVSLHSSQLDDQQHAALVETFSAQDTEVEAISGKLKAIAENL